MSFGIPVRNSVALGMGGYASLSTGAPDMPIFNLPLQNSIVPDFSAGSSTPTFTRADGTNITGSAFCTDFSGRLVLVPPGVPRIQGARFVRNILLGKSNDFTSASWVASASMVKTANSLTADGVGNQFVQNGAGGAIVGTRVARVKITRLVGTGNIQLSLDGGSTYTTVATGAFAPAIYTVSQTASFLAGSGLVIRIVSANDSIQVEEAQLEDVTGATNQAPSEYVSVGVLSAPYHGAGIDGVRWFKTLNGNTVSSNVVTEATGAAINSSEAACAGGVTAGVVDASGPLGYISESAATNSLTYSQQFDNAAWSLLSGATITANQAVAPDGTTTADLLNLVTASGVGVQQAGAVTNGSPATCSVYIKANGLRWVYFDFYDSASNNCWFDLLNGVVGTKAAGITSHSITALPNGWYRIVATRTVNAATAYCSIRASDADNSTSFTQTGSLGAYLWQADLVAASFPSSPITTTTVALTRAADVLTYASAGNISGTVGSIYYEGLIPSGYNATSRGVWDQGDAGGLETVANPGTLLYDGANTATATTPALSTTTVNKHAGSWGATLLAVQNGGTVVSATFDGSLGFATTIQIGGNGGNAVMNGTIRNVRIYSKALSAAQLQSITT